MKRNRIVMFSGAGLIGVLLLSCVTAESRGRVEFRPEGKIVVGFQKEPLPTPVGGEKFAASAFIHPFCTPGGFELTTIQPSDHLHHFGIWWPWKYIEVDGKKYNTWEIQELQGAHVTREVRELPCTNNAIKAWELHNETIIKSKQGEAKVAIREVAQVTVQATDEATVLDVTLRQKAGDTPVTIVNYRYSGFSWRGPQSWNKDNSTMLTSAGKGCDQANGTPARWVVVSGPTPNGMASILLLSAAERLAGAPEKLRVWGSANQNGEPFVNFNPVMQKSLPLSDASPAVSNRKYRVIAMDKVIDAATAEAAWKKWMAD
jgi:Methane oxygenase PmoA